MANRRTDTGRTGSAGPREDRLAAYRKLRRFDRTPEPSADAPASSAEEAAPGVEPSKVFVVQKHDATRLHYDLRLEIDGAMMSWAVPKGVGSPGTELEFAL